MRFFRQQAPQHALREAERVAPRCSAIATRSGGADALAAPRFLHPSPIQLDRGRSSRSGPCGEGFARRMSVSLDDMAGRPSSE